MSDKKQLKVPSVFYYGTGKRKCAIAKVWLFEGNGNIEVNRMNYIDYFGNKLIADPILNPLNILSLNKKYSVKISLLGGGKAAQIDACILGISRAILELNSQFRDALKSEGYLTRDPRVKERKKYGLRKARKAPQFRKR
ncbi:30S ribosomal protein S9 [Candidatus Marinamargulisbacteria bacterium SCGC AG-343-D04]|nr:30S ribosomal protein S9 [Candidatus Marinamargulisbacteria bacterium SCGC AG-343-D04]